MVLKRKSKNVDASLNFRHDGGGRLSPLNGSKSFKGKSIQIPTSSSPRQSLSRGPQYLKTKKKQKPGFPIKNFGNDEGGGFPATDLGDEREQQDTHHSSRSSPSTKKLQLVLHFFSRLSSNQLQKTTHLFSNGIMLLSCKDDPCMGFTLRQILCMKPIVITNIKTI